MPTEAQVTKSAVDRLKSAIQAKRKADKALAQLEQSIAAFEGSYLSETALSGGNIIKGFDNYLKVNPNMKRRTEVQDADRLFSMSSGSYQASMNLLQAEGEEKNRSKAEGSYADDAQSTANANKKRKREESVMSGTGDDSQPPSRANGHGGRRVKGQSARAEDD
ncbi:hypothetical protein NliqN6_1698 [Naganishia liquefaciens]|uniref:Chromatin modification-related protein EAF6 n=1 Tax=Naganishia liquefaciens TaxID=104408 RepID=A0A8H3TQV9_9TREE|nr:hypothetical protein NliqN6_1698 [Naganishia liquefaciens]